MPLAITILKSPQHVKNSQSQLTFSENGGTLGRGPDNTWVLDDPDKYMSSVHAQISFDNGQYMLTDLSTNGTFINEAAEPLGSGNTVALSEGDHFGISDYEFIVNLSGAAPAQNGFSSHASDRGPFSTMSASELSGADSGANSGAGSQVSLQNDPFGAGSNNFVPIADAMSGFDAAETDPLAAFDQADSRHSPPVHEDPFASNSMAGHGGTIDDAISWPAANMESSMIPDDWNEDNQNEKRPSPVMPQTAKVESLDETSDSQNIYTEALTTLENECLSLQEENKKLSTQVIKLKQYIKKHNLVKNSASTVSNASTVTSKAETISHRELNQTDKTLMEALGFMDKNLSKEKTKEISATVGYFVRETLEGMMRVLSFRKKIKEEFRINVTTIQPVENNPLKFSANIDDAMENMFIKDNNAYKEPIEAVREGFQGIAEHQIAVLAGMQAAFRGMLERFDPETLEKRFEKYQSSRLIKIGKNRKHWDSYKEYHAELAENVDDSFQHLFGYDFVQAYEEQMQRLVISRKSTK
ncbi:MAG: type VI secretion system-associated FHA domain protein TagH [Ectothiorhodospiraceae bacterium]|nr:type VI secretion system-associated FHA domain protein TagH [Ectothiorhodospiraceae bacterium]